MNARRIDQIWLFGGLALTILLAVGGWFLVISPQYTARDSVQTDTADTRIQLTKEQRKLAELKAQLKKVDTYEDTLVEAQKALPYGENTNKIPEFLKQLQVLGSKYGVDVSGYSASVPEESKTTPAIKQLPITLNIESGKVDKIIDFVERLQTMQPRAVLIESAKLSGDNTDGWELNLSLSAFITTTQTISVDS
ncbi:type 4a pilus biogenesis protein PilO [Actinoplanes flavus]|uniref:Type 4a pilus biogenesis protein PilO n=1 Tax=Actinoplanes flavus TaxID=2820290 RepID=A0ABS3ULI1_9ACTN|nr:type 4a pilus biogenesis protein PilO [Actinoplanes flavus]MBO3739642.1 type 4a pilus biogenesis protein PilO [Actinoplanes flavus]